MSAGAGPGPADSPPVATGVRTAGRNAAWLLSGQLVSKVASVVFVVIVARALGVVEYGYFTFATAFVPLFLAFGTLGLDTAVVRELSQDRERLSEVFASGLAVRVLTAGAALVVSLLLTPLFADARLAALTVLVVGVALFVDEMTGYVGTVFKAFEQMRYAAVALVVNRTLSTAMALVAYLADAGLLVITVLYLAGSVGALVYAATSLRRHFPPVRLSSRQRATAVRLLRTGAPLGVAAVLNMALFRLDTVMVQALTDARQVGLYGVAFRFFESFLFVTWVMANVVFPRVARSGRTRQSARLLQVSTTVVLAAYLPLLVGSAFLAPWAVALAFGDRYVEAADAVPWLVAALVFQGVTYQVRNATVALGGGAGIAWIAAVALTCNVPLNLVLIDRSGFVGAAMATAAVSAGEAVLTVLMARGFGLLRRPAAWTAAPVLAAAATGLLLAGTGATGAAGAAVAAVAYLAALAVLTALLAPAALRAARSRLAARSSGPADVSGRARRRARRAGR